jgi:FkbH-like protein|tara:strand:- start:1593 stop:3326 length:1734 start_codon:yes stop_codon:yes gene_type:complete
MKNLKKKNHKNNKIKIKIAILGGSTTKLIKENLEIFLKDRNLDPKFYESDYNQFYYEGIKPSKTLKKFNPNFIYIHTSSLNIDEFPEVESKKKQSEKLIENTFNKYRSIWTNLSKNFDCNIIQNNFEMLSLTSLGNLDSSKHYGKINFITKLNLKFFEYSNKVNNLIIQDINLISAQYGLDKWHDDSFYFNYKYALNHEAIPTLTKNITKIIESQIGKSKKCLLLDFDNTLWGGVIGEIGWKNIQIGNDSALGQVYLRFQKYVFELMSKGVILAGCTKNDNDVALSGFKNDSNILKKKHFSIIKANWENKAKNIMEISKELNIGLDSMVFIDDSKFERELVKKQLPMVEVPNIGDDPEKYIFYLDREKYFENSKLSNEDLQRTSFYKTNIEREKDQNNFKDYNEYLKSLKMKSNLKSFKNENIDRIYQLINKTNQFNLTTKRMNINETKNIIDNSNFLTFAGNLNDKFGENGIVTILIVKIKKNKVEIIQWLMSCRVFNRGLEFAIFDQLISWCKNNSILTIQGLYIPTKKNFIVKNFYKNLGFNKINRNNNNTIWEFKIPKKYIIKNNNIKINYEN